MKKNRDIGLQIVAYRRQMNWSQEKLAEEAGLSKLTVGRIERDESIPTFETLEKIENAFRLPPNTIIGELQKEFLEDDLTEKAIIRSVLYEMRKRRMSEEKMIVFKKVAIALIEALSRLNE